MTTEENKLKDTLWWIASIAVSVLCCSALFVLFASYLVQVRDDIHDSKIRLNTIEARQDAILAEIESLRKRSATAQQAPVATDGVAAVATPVAVPVGSTVPLAPAAVPVAAPPAAPAIAVPVLTPAVSVPALPAPAAAPVPVPPTLAAPSPATAPDKK